MQDFLSTFLSSLKQRLDIELYPLSRGKEKQNKAFIIYEISHEELNLSLDNKILSKELEINLSLYALKYKDLRELKNKIELFVLEFEKKPIEILSNNENKDELSGFFMSEIFITYQI